MARVCKVGFVSAARVTAVTVVQIFAQMHAAGMGIALMGLACAMPVGPPATAPLLVAAAAMVLATHLMVVVCATTVGLVKSATMSSSAKTQHVQVTVCVRMVFAYALQDIVANLANLVSAAATVCVVSMGLAIMPQVNVCVVVVGSDCFVTWKRLRA